MNSALTPEQETFAATVRTFATRELAAGAVERAHAPAFPWDVAKALADQSLLRLTMNPGDGGAGAGR